MAVLSNTIYIGSLTDPMYVFHNEDVHSVPSMQAVALVGQDLSIDTFSPVVSATWDNVHNVEILRAEGAEGIVVGILKPAPDAVATSLTGAVAYLPSLTEYVLRAIQESGIVTEQLADPSTDVITGLPFDDGVNSVLTDDEKAARIFSYFSALSDRNIAVDMIVQSIRNIEKNVTDMVFTIAQDDLAEAKQIVDGVADKLHAVAVLIEEDVAKVSIVGAGMLGNPGIATRMFGALADAKVNIDAISTSEISISCLIKGSQLKEAANAIHKEFFPEK